MKIPKIIHQTWKTDEIPYRWQAAVSSVKRYHPGWDYRLWTDQTMDDFVRIQRPDFYPVFKAFPYEIMRADSFRYCLMAEIGGLYCDLDYEFLRPYDYGDKQVVFSKERSTSYGDPADTVANYIFASIKGHKIWHDIIDELKNNPPIVGNYQDVVGATGPGLLGRIFFRNTYDEVTLTERVLFSPARLHSGNERKILRNGGVAYGFHYGSGVWKDRFSLTYAKVKLKKIGRRLGLA